MENITTIKKVGVIGCGQMGIGIVETCARAGFNVLVREIDADLLQKGLKKVRGSLSKAVERGKLAQVDMDAALERIQGTVNLAEFKDCDLVIEAVSENLALKKTVFAELDSVCQPEAILATNTSSLCVTEVAAATARPEKVIGLHFFNPVPVMALLEIVRGLLTSQETLQAAAQFASSLGKTAVMAKDRPGFLVNLLLVPYILDAIRWLDAGLASKEDMDAAVKLGLGYPMGPFTLVDFIGLDTILLVADAMFEEFKDARYAAPPLLRRMVQAGLLGRKSGHGFYNYAGS